MMFWTHLVFSSFIGLVLDYFFNLGILFVVLVAFFGIFPDIDEKSSKISRKTRLLSWPFRFLFKHRGTFHSIFIPLILFLIFYYLSFKIISYAIVIGYLSHLLLDLINHAGISPLAPIPIKIKGFCKSNGIINWIFFVLFFVLDVVLVYFIFF